MEAPSVNDSATQIDRIEQAIPDLKDPNTPHDRVLVVGNTKFYVYAGLLSTFSEYFRGLFYSGFSESKEKEIVLKDLCPDHFHLFLKLLLPSREKRLFTSSQFEVLLALSQQFLCSYGIAACHGFFMDEFDKTDKFELLEIAFKHDIKPLKDKIAEFLTTSDSRGIVAECAPPRNSHGCQRGVNHCFYCKGKLTLRDGFPLESCLYLVENQERLKKLSSEIQLFVFYALLEKAKFVE